MYQGETIKSDFLQNRPDHKGSQVLLLAMINLNHSQGCKFHFPGKDYTLAFLYPSDQRYNQVQHQVRAIITAKVSPTHTLGSDSW